MAENNQDTIYEKRLEKTLDEVLVRLTKVELVLEKMSAESPLMERLERAENRILENRVASLEDKSEKRVQALEKVVFSHRADCESFRSKAWGIVAFVIVTVIGAIMSLIFL